MERHRDWGYCELEGFLEEGASLSGSPSLGDLPPLLQYLERFGCHTWEGRVFLVLGMLGSSCVALDGVHSMSVSGPDTSRGSAEHSDPNCFFSWVGTMVRDSG